MADFLPRVFLSIRVLATAVMAISAVDGVRLNFTAPSEHFWMNVAMHLCAITCVWFPRVGALLSLLIIGLSPSVERYSYAFLTAPLAIFASTLSRHYRYAAAVAAASLGLGVALWVLPPHHEGFLWLMALLTASGAGLGAAMSYMLWTQQRMQALVKAQLQLRDLASRSEREDLASAIHDHIGHSLAVSAMIAARHSSVEDHQLASAFARIHAECRAGSTHLADAVALLRDGEARTSIIPGHPSAVAALMSQTLDECGFAVVTNIDGQPDRLPQEARKLIGRFLVETTTNVLKHGQPGDRVTVEVRSVPSSYVATITNPIRNQRWMSHPAPGGSGLGALRAEALSKDADITTDSTSGRFTVTLSGVVDDLSDLIPGGWMTAGPADTPIG